MSVKAGFRGGLSLNIAGAGLIALGIRQMTVRETIDNHDTSSTASAIDVAGLLPETRIQGKKRCRLNISAQYSAGGAGDPPNFGGTNLYGDIGVQATAGDQVTGNFMVEEYANLLNVDGTIDYELGMISDGAYTRVRGS
jgi:hypothetical protein